MKNRTIAVLCVLAAAIAIALGTGAQTPVIGGSSSSNGNISTNASFPITAISGTTAGNYGLNTVANFSINPSTGIITVPTEIDSRTGTGLIVRAPTSQSLTLGSGGSTAIIIDSSFNAHGAADNITGFGNVSNGFTTFFAHTISTTNGTTSGWDVDANGVEHQTGTAPSVSAGSICTNSTNAYGCISGLSAATTVTLTFANSGWTNNAFCTGSANAALTTPVYVSAQSKTAATFTFSSLTGTLYYTCGGS